MPYLFACQLQVKRFSKSFQTQNDLQSRFTDRFRDKTT